MQKRVTCPLRPLMIKSGIIGKKTQSSSPSNVMDGFGNGSFDLWKYNLREKVILSEDLVSGGLGFWTRNGVPPVFANSSEGDSLSVLFM